MTTYPDTIESNMTISVMRSAHRDILLEIVLR